MRMFKSLIFLSSIFCLAGCFEKTNEEKQESTPEVVINHDYNEVSDYELTWETMFDVDSDLYYVYFYSPSCTHCADLKNYIIGKALTNENIYFVKGSSKDQIGNEADKVKNAENPGDIWILGYPSLIQISKHKCTKNLAGINQIKAELK